MFLADFIARHVAPLSKAILREGSYATNLALTCFLYIARDAISRNSVLINFALEPGKSVISGSSL